MVAIKSNGSPAKEGCNRLVVAGSEGTGGDTPVHLQKKDVPVARLLAQCHILGLQDGSACCVKDRLHP